MKNMNGLIRAGLTGIFVFLFGTSTLLAQPDTLSFLHISDIHLIFDLEKFQPNLAETRKHYANGVEPFKNRSSCELTAKGMLYFLADFSNSPTISLLGPILTEFQA